MFQITYCNSSYHYSKATEVNIVLQKKNDSLKMIVMDNGEGFNAESEYPGNGLKNMQSRAAAMNAALKIDSIKGTGTTIALEVIIT